MRTLLVVDDHRIVFEGIEVRLRHHFNLIHASSCAEAKEIAFTRTVEAAILDITCGDENGMDLAFELKKAVPHIFFFSMHRSAALITKAQTEGYNGFFLKDESIEEMVDALLYPTRRKFWITDSVKELLEKQSFQTDEKYDTLTPREQQIFRLIAEGKKPRDISKALNISPKTISVHRENLLRKMDLATNTEITREAIRLGIVEV